MKIKSSIVAVLSAFAFVACVQNELIPDQNIPSVSFAAQSVSIAKSGETIVTSINTNCDWTLMSGADWIKVAPASGTSATKSVTLTVETECPTDRRDGEVYLACASDPSVCDTLFVAQKSGIGGIITNAEDFVSFLELAEGITEGDEISLGADIDLGGAEITPAASFSGVFDGKGYKVYNFKVVSSLSLAGVILQNKGTVRNVVVGSADGKSWDNVSTIGFASSASASAAGFVATNSGTIENVINFAKVDCNAGAVRDACAGGIAGGIGDSAAIIKDCKNYGMVTISGTMSDRACFGGILGLSDQEGAKVENCVNYGTIAKSSINQKELAFAGVVGRANAAMFISGCSNEGIVSYTTTDKPGSYIHLAGILGAGYYGVQIVNCTNKGDISSVIIQVNRMGGIAGTMNTGGLIDGCTNTGTISLEQGANANWQSLGGICGFEEKGSSSSSLVIKNNTNNGTVKFNLSNTNTHDNLTAIGGVIGTTCSVVEYKDNVNNGEISGINSGSAAVYGGGIIGWYRKGTGLKSSGNVNNGKVSVTAPSGAAGGIIGYQSVASCNLSEETNKGEVSYANAAATGSIAGLTAGAINSCAVGGTVNGTAVTSSNFASLTIGSSSTGAAAGCYAAEGGAGPTPFINATPASITFVAGGEDKVVNVSSNCEWTATSSDSWLSLSAASGNADVASLTLTASENTAKTERSATVTITCKTDSKVSSVITVKQEPHVDGLSGKTISSVAELKAFAVSAASATAGDVYTLESDLTITSADFVCIESFAGEFDGKNHVITYDVTADARFVSLFQTVTGTVRNLKTAGSLKTIYSGAEEYFVAAVASYVDGGTVENCTNNATITSASTIGTANKYGYAGGVVGQFKSDGATVRNCVNNGKVVFNSPSCAIVGGVAAYGVTSAAAPSLTLDNCVNAGDIVMDHSGGNWDYIGGIVGKMGASSNPFTMYYIRNCKSSGNISIEKAPKTRGGGVLGSGGFANDYEISGCEFSGKIEIKDKSAVDRVFAGIGAGNSEAGAIGTVKNCTFSGSLTAEDGGNIYLGGIYGNNGSASIVIDGCKTTSTAVINGGSAAKSTGMIAGRPNKDGFTIKNCKLAGKITNAMGDEIVISASNIEEWMVRGTGTIVSIVLDNNTFNAE